jgi:hypothetical protein
MPTTPESPRPRRTKAKLTQAALANRLAATLDPKIVATESAPPAPSKPAAAAPSVKPAVSKPATPAPGPGRRAPAAAPSQILDAGLDRLTGAVSSAQEIARDAARSLADSRLLAAQSMVTFQKMLLEMVHANLHEGFAAAQQMITAPNVGEAIRVQSRFAKTRIKALGDQAAELRSLSTKLAKEAQEPWAAQMAKSLERLKSGLVA